MLLELERNRERRMRGVWPRTLLHHHRPRSLVEVDLRFEYNRHSHLQRHPLVEQSLPIFPINLIINFLIFINLFFQFSAS